VCRPMLHRGNVSPKQYGTCTYSCVIKTLSLCPILTTKGKRRCQQIAAWDITVLGNDLRVCPRHYDVIDDLPTVDEELEFLSTRVFTED